MKTRMMLLGGLLALLLSPVASGLSIDTQVDLMLNSLRFDMGLESRMADGLKIGVVSLEGDAQGKSVAMRAERAFKALVEKRFAGKPVEVLWIHAPSPDELVARMDEQGFDLLFICPSPEECLKKLLNAAARGKVLALATDADAVAAGAALAVVDRAGRPRILLNVDAARKQGARFKASFLRMAECVRSGGELKPVYQHPALVGKRKLRGKDPDYPKMARLAKKEATVVAKLVIASDGSVRDVKFLKTDKLFEPAVRSALASWRFKPHHVAGRAVPTYTVMNFKFNLR